MALPRELVSLPMPRGLQALKTKIVELQPANATGTTSFGATGSNRIMFNIPAFPSAFLQTSRSFLSFRGKVKCKTSTDNANTIAFVDGVPVIERLVVRGGNGVLLEDIRDYDVIERMLTNFDEWSHKYADSGEIGDFRAYRYLGAMKDALFKADTGKHAQTPDADGIAFHRKTYRKPLISGLFGRDQEKALPLGLMSATGGYAFQIELYLNSNEKACENLTTGGAQPAYSLDDVKLTLSLLEVPADIYADMNAELLQNNRFILPFKRIQTHKHYLGAQANKFNINIHESAKNVERLMAVLRPQGSNKLEFQGGAQATQKVKMFQSRYGTHYYPQQAVEMMDKTDSSLMLSHSLAGMDMLERGQPLLATYDENNNLRWEATDFALIQSFKTSRDDVANGLNSLSSGAPIQLDFTFHDPLTAAQELLCFMVEDQVLVLGNGGSVALLE